MGTLLGEILSCAEGEGFAPATLHYSRVEVVRSALEAANAIMERSGDAPFSIPRALCASFEGRNPDLTPHDEATEADLAELFRGFDGRFPRSDAESFERQRRGGNWWFEPALLLPPEPRVRAGMSDVEAIEAMFGPAIETFERMEAERQALQGWRDGRPRPSLKRKLAEFLGINAFGAAAMIGALHFVGRIAALVALVLWIGILCKRLV